MRIEISEVMVEHVGDDRVGYFRLAQDCLIIIEISDDAIQRGDWIASRHPVQTFGVVPHGA